MGYQGDHGFLNDPYQKPMMFMGDLNDFAENQ